MDESVSLVMNNIIRGFSYGYFYKYLKKMFLTTPNLLKCDKNYQSESIVVTVPCKLSFLIVDLKTISLSTLALKSPITVYARYDGNRIKQCGLRTLIIISLKFSSSLSPYNIQIL